MASAAVKARLKALRQKYGLGEFKKKRASARGSGKMARRKYATHRRGKRSGGIMSWVKPIIAGAIGDEIATQASVRGINVVQHQDKLGGAAGGYFAKRNVTGAILGIAGGMLKDVALGRDPMAGSTIAATNQQLL